MTENSSKLLIFFVVLVVILSAVFTWQTLGISFEGKEEKNSASENQVVQNNIIKGGVGINLQPKSNGG